MAALLVFWLGIGSLSGLMAYIAAVVTGLSVALIAGKPIWVRGAWVEVLLKAIAAALLGAGLLFAARSTLDVSASLGPLGAGKLTELPFVILPALGTLLAVFFEIDNTGDDQAAPPAERQAGARRRVEPNALSGVDEELEAEAEEQRGVRRH